MTEEWRDVVGYEGLYQVSNTGKVRSMNYRRSGAARDLVQTLTNGYPIVCLSASGKQKNHTVHTLVAAAFLGNRPDGYEVNHINAVKNDNRIENLEYVTPSENSYYREAFKVIRHPYLGMEWHMECYSERINKELSKPPSEERDFTLNSYYRQISYLQRVAKINQS